MRRRGTPAGQVLVTAVAALCLAALVNADALVERAEQKPFGPGRDRSLAIWHPVQDVAHVLQLHRIRQLGDRLAGNDDAGSGGAASPTTAATAPAGPGRTTTTVPPRPELRVPTVADPLRVWIGGDSIMRDGSESFLRLAADDPLLAPFAHYKISSGLTRPDFYDWPAVLDEQTAEHRSEVVIVMFGANDAQGIVGPDGTVYESVDLPGWQAEYGRRVEALMDQLRADGRLVLWVGQPPMRDPGFDGRIQILNGIYEEAAEDRPWVDFVDTAPLFGGAGGGYARPELRQGDGTHLSREGADLLAEHLLGLIADELPAPAPTTTSPPPTTGRTGTEVPVATEG